MSKQFGHFQLGSVQNSDPTGAGGGIE